MKPTSATSSIASKTCSANLKHYPALDIAAPQTDPLLAALDDLSPTAIDERDSMVRVFFVSASERDAAQRALASRFDVTPIEVPDEDWARRSQADLKPVTVGRITVFPSPQPPVPSPLAISLVILPSMGFGTGHHVTTRLCLAALQSIDLDGRVVLDVGTGSGVLAIAADRLGAAHAIGIDNDADAIQSARENLALNPDAAHVAFEVADLRDAALPKANVVTANLTGTLLIRAAAELLAAVRSGGALIASGLLAEERAAVLQALGGEAVWERADDGWAALIVKKA